MVLLLIIVAIFIWVIHKEIWSLFDHSEVLSYELQPDAEIVHIKTERVQYTRNNAKFKTTVYFSDGFSFVSHKTDREDGFFRYRISVGPELRERIISKAIIAHNRAIERQKKL